LSPWPLILGAGLLLGGFAGREVRSFERAAAADIASRLQGDSKEVKVGVELDGPFRAATGRLAVATITARNFSLESLPLFTEPERSKKGRVDVLRLRLYDFNLRGLRIQELSADINDCRYDYNLAIREKKVRLSKSGFGPGYARVDAKALEDFILHKYSEIKSIKVQLKKYKVFVEGTGDFLLFKSNFYVIADLVPRNGTELWLENTIVFMDGVRVRDGSERALLQALNPVIDENKDLKLYGALRMERVAIHDGYLELFGTATIPELPK
jgi:hypothetical protein